MLTAARLEQVQGTLDAIQRAREAIVRLADGENESRPELRRDVKIGDLADRVDGVALELERLYS